MDGFDRRDTSWGVIVVDVDHFKDYNDSHGHQAGDEVLIKVSRFLMRHVRAEDPVVRIGGDEFLALLLSEGRELSPEAAASDPLGPRRRGARTPVVRLGTARGVRDPGPDDRPGRPQPDPTANRATWRAQRRAQRRRAAACAAAIAMGIPLGAAEATDESRSRDQRPGPRSGRRIALADHQIELPEGLTVADWTLEKIRWQNPRIRTFLGCIRLLGGVLESNYAILHCSPERLRDIWSKVQQVGRLIRSEMAPLLGTPSRFPALEQARLRAELSLDMLSDSVLRDLESIEARDPNRSAAPGAQAAVRFDRQDPRLSAGRLRRAHGERPP